MNRETVLTNARIVLDDEILHGTIRIRDGVILDVSPATGTPGLVGEDFEGDYLLPGLVELHTDHLESHMRPRPGTEWDAIPAVLSHDAQMAGAGVTTVFDAVRIGKVDGQDDAVNRARAMADAITHAADADILRAEHYLHLRCEVAAPNAIREFEDFDDVASVRLASLMDHTPGQRQYADVETFRSYMVGRGRVRAEDFPALMVERQRVADEFSLPNRRGIAERASARGLTLAAHDDATLEHVEESGGLGVRISEFPTTEVAARAARALGQLIVLGAPNIVRGGSQSGNVSASDLLAQDLLDVLSSDYVPFSPLQAVFRAVAEGMIGLPQGARLVSTNPAAAVGLVDRGSDPPRAPRRCRARPLVQGGSGWSTPVRSAGAGGPRGLARWAASRLSESTGRMLGEKAGIAAIGPGAFVALVGPSGVGKDAILDYARERTDGVVFVQRVITRAPAGGEASLEVSESEYDATDARGGFAVSWRAHGLGYGIPTSVDDAIRADRVVIANASRTVIESLDDRYARFRLVRVSAPPELRAARLAARNRESEAGIAERTTRTDPAPDAVAHLEIVNDRSIADAGEQLLDFLRELQL